MYIVVNILFINVYLPYHCEDNYDTYIEHLAILNNIISNSDSSNFTVIGDINSHTSTMFGDEISDLCERLDLSISDDLFTYVSDAHATTSWLNHDIWSKDMHSLFNRIYIFQTKLR